MSGSADLATAGARARGLQLHVLGRDRIEQLAGADPRALAEGIGRELGVPVPPSAGPADIEAAVRRHAAAVLRRFARWPGSEPAVSVFEAEQDRRALRAMMRGAVQAAPRQERLAGLLPTSSLPERALTELAGQPTPARVAAHLLVLGHPDAGRLSRAAAGTQPGLFALDLELVRGFALRSGRAARAADRGLHEHVSRRIDVCNAELALGLAAAPGELEPRASFVDGGANLTPEAFARVCTAGGGAPGPGAALARELAGTTLAQVAADAAGSATRLERLAFVHELALQQDACRRDPLGSAPAVLLLLRLQAQSADVARLAWGAAFGMGAAAITEGLVTPWS